MTGIFSGIQAILNTIFAPIKFLGIVIQTLIKFGELIVNVYTNLTTNILTLPTWLMNYVVISIAVIILMRVLGRST